MKNRRTGCRDHRRLTPRRRLAVEPLEDRRMLSVAPSTSEFQPVEPLGGLVYESQSFGYIGLPDEVDPTTVELDAGQTLTVVVDPITGLRPVVRLRDPSGGSIGHATAAAAGSSAIIQTAATTTGGTYTIVIAGLQQTTGSYFVRRILNAAVEVEVHGGAANDAPARAQGLHASFLSLGAATAQRGAVLGTLPADTAGEDWYRFALADGQSSTLALQSASSDEVTLELYDGGAHLLAAGLTAENVDQVINNFVDATANAAPDIYYARVSGSGGEYSLLVTRDADFDTEPNEAANWQSQDIAPGSVVLGHLDAAGSTLYAQRQVFRPGQPAQQPRLGYSVSISGQTIIAGCPYDFHGAAYVFQQTDSGWGQTAKLLPDHTAGESRFGYSVSISGNLAIVGAPYDDQNIEASGSAYIFRDTGSGWTQVAKLMPPQPARYGRFGHCVAISGSTAVVSGSGHSDRGVYVFEDAGSGWEHTATFQPRGFPGLGYLQRPISISGETVVIGAYLDGGSLPGDWSGSAYVYQKSDTGWSEVAKLRSPNPREDDCFGYSVSVSGNRAIIGERPANWPLAPGDSGAAYIFEDTGSGWHEVAKLVPEHDGPNDEFPHYRLSPAVVISGDTAIVGAEYGGDGNDGYSGLAFVFRQTESGWSQVAELTSDDYTRWDQFGSGIALGGKTVVVGSLGDNEGDGAIYVHTGAVEDAYRVDVLAGDELVVATDTPGGGDDLPGRPLDPMIELRNSSGDLLAFDDNSGPDGRNARLTYVATESDGYIIKVTANQTWGDYLLSITGDNGALPGFAVVAPDPGSDLTLGYLPGRIQLGFSDTVLASSLDAADLTIGGVPATGVTVVDGDTIGFDLPAELADGTHTVSIAAGAILDVQGTPIEAYSFQLTLETTTPAVSVYPHWTFDGRPPFWGSVDDPLAKIEVTVDGETYRAQNLGDGTWGLPEGTIDPPLAPGTYDVEVTATNALGNVGTDATRDELTVWAGAAIRGTIFDDADNDGLRDDGEPGLPGVRVFLDSNRNGRLNSGEPRQLTWEDHPDTPDVDESGWYAFTGLEPGSYVVSEEPPEGSQQTAPHLLQGWPGLRTETLSPPPDARTTNGGRLIGLDDLWEDPRFAGLKGQSYAAVVLDTGADLDHPFFGPDDDGDGVADRIVYQSDFVDGDDDAGDDDGHGTHVTSIIGSQDSQYPGMAPEVNLIVLRVMTEEGEGDFGDVEQALRWVIDNVSTYNIASLNMSLGDGENHTRPRTLYGVGNDLATLAELDVIVSSSSGNDFHELQSALGVNYPAADRNSLSIGAVYASGSRGYEYQDDDGNTSAEAFSSGADRIAPFSQRHDTLTTLFAPGAPIIGAGLDGQTVGYHGTSQAAAHVSGVAVLAQQLAVEHLGRRLTPEEFAEIARTSGASIRDGDDEDDNVTNSGLFFRRLSVLSLAENIVAMGDLPGRHVLRLGLDQVITGADFGNFSPWQDLGAVDFEHFDDLPTGPEPLRYLLETVRGGLLTLAADPSGPAHGVKLTLYDEDPVANPAAVALATSTVVDASQRIDWQVGDGERYYFTVEGPAGSVDLKVVNLVRPGLNSLIVHGTEGDDTFEVVPQTTEAVGTGLRRVTINGVSYELSAAMDAPPSEAALLVFDGHAGADTATLQGTSGKETAMLRPDATVVTGAGLEARLLGSSDVTVLGSGGDDEADFFDSAGDDAFIGSPTYAAMYGDGYHNRVRDFAAVSAQAGQGTDVAKFYDSPGNDNYVATPTYNEVSGQGFKNIARRFEGTHVYATAGGVDVARFYDSAYGDSYVASPTYAALFSDPDQQQPRFFNRAKYFEGVHAYATAGGVDTARFYDSPANDDFIAAPTYAALYNPTYREAYTVGFFNRAKFFEAAHAFATAGGNDLARLYDSPDDDVFYADPEHGAMFRPGEYYNRAKFFEGVHAFATDGGRDTARLHGSGGDDRFVADPIQGALFRPGAYYNRAKFFEQVDAYAEGGDDEAFLHDSAMADFLEADARWAQLSNGQLDFANRAEGFGYVKAISSSDGDTKSVSAAVDFLFYEGIWSDR